MTLLAWLFVLVGGAPLLAIAVTARPVRAEHALGFHLTVLPIVLTFTLGLGLGVAAEWRQPALPAAALYAALPGWFVALVGLVFVCLDRARVRREQLLIYLAVAAPVAVLAGAHVHRWLQLAGGIYVLALAAGALLVVAAKWVIPRWR